MKTVTGLRELARVTRRISVAVALARTLAATLTCCPVGIAVAADSSLWDSVRSKVTANSRSKPPYPVLDSRTVVYTDGVGAPPFFWINNEEVLFVELRIVPDASTDSKERWMYALKSWNTTTGAVSHHRDFGTGRPRLCFFQDYLLVTVRHGDTYEVYHGPLNKLRSDDLRRGYNDVVCRPADMLPPLPAWTEGRQTRWLQSLDAGFVDFGDLKNGFGFTQLRLYRHGARQGQSIDLPLYKRRVISRFPYYSFKDAFFVQGDWDVQPRPKEAPFPVYWLYRDGRVETIAEIPWGPWRTRAAFGVVPTARGLVMISSSMKSHRDLGDAGIYLFNLTHIQKILRAWVDNHALDVSPNGCKIAFSYADHITRKTNVLRAVDLCSGGWK